LFILRAAGANNFSPIPVLGTIASDINLALAQELPNLPAVYKPNCEALPSIGNTDIPPSIAALT
jgi:hypothetical protein